MKCMRDGCKNDGKHRGLCQSHYQQTRMAIKSGKTSWDELVSLGLANEAERLTFDFILETARAKAKKESEEN